MKNIILILIAITTLLSAISTEKTQKCEQVLEPTSFISKFPKGGASGQWSKKCDTNLTKDFPERDKLKDFVKCDIKSIKAENQHFGPNASIYPKVEAKIVEGCDPIKWQQQRILSLVHHIITKKYNYCHHHAPTWTPEAKHLKVPLEVCPPAVNGKKSSGDPQLAEGTCSTGRMMHNEPVWNGIDCSTYSSYLYNYGFGAFLVTNIQKQGCDAKGPGRILNLKVDDVHKFQVADLIYLFRGDGAEKPYVISHVIVWTGIEMTFVGDGPYSYNTIKKNVPECQWDKQDAYIQAQRKAKKPVYIISDSHWNGPGLRPFAGWYINNFAHVRRIIGMHEETKSHESKYCVKSNFLKN